MEQLKTLVLNTVGTTPPPLGINVLLWIEVGPNVLDCGWVRAERVSNLLAEAPIDFSQEGVNKELVWICEGIPQEMRNDHLWSLPSIKIVDSSLLSEGMRLTSTERQSETTSCY